MIVHLLCVYICVAGGCGGVCGVPAAPHHKYLYDFYIYGAGGCGGVCGLPAAPHHKY